MLDDMTTDGTTRRLTPDEIGVFVRTLREMQGWTQETLAELSGLQTRTIQRVEQGQPSSLDTRRALARAFNLKDIDLLSKALTLPSEEELKRQKEAFDREYVLLDVQQVGGRELLVLMQEAPAFRAVIAGSMAELPRDAQDAFAIVVDYVSDCIDIFDVASRTEILECGDGLNERIAELKSAGFCLCAAFRDVKASEGGHGISLPCRIFYLLAGPNDHPQQKVAVTRKVQYAL